MIRSCAALVIAAASVLAASHAAAQSPADSSSTPAARAYSADQAAEGEYTFRHTCGNCHGTAEFSGPSFLDIWSGRPVYELFDQLRNAMPLDNPGGLSAGEYAAVIAYILKLNGVPAGPAPLPSSDAELRRIRF